MSVLQCNQIYDEIISNPTYYIQKLSFLPFKSIILKNIRLRRFCFLLHFKLTKFIQVSNMYLLYFLNIQKYFLFTFWFKIFTLLCICFKIFRFKISNKCSIYQSVYKSGNFENHCIITILYTKMNNDRVYLKNDNFYMAVLKQKKQKEIQQFAKLKNQKQSKSKRNATEIKQQREKKQFKQINQKILQQYRIQNAQDHFKIPENNFFSKKKADTNEYNNLLSKLKKQKQVNVIKTEKKLQEKRIILQNIFQSMDNNEAQINLKQQINQKSQSKNIPKIDDIIGDLKQDIQKTNDKLKSGQKQNIQQKKAIQKEFDNQKDEDDEFKKILMEQPIKRQKDNNENSNKNKNIIKSLIFAPKSTLKTPIQIPSVITKTDNTQVFQNVNKKGKSVKKVKKQVQKTQKQIMIQNRKEDQKMRKDLKRLQYQSKNGKTNKNNNQIVQGQQKSNDIKQAQGEGKKGNNKKIKKVNNYQRMDLKRKYKDQFVGGLKDNQRRFQKNGALKHKFRLAQSQLQLEGGQVHNTYIHSLSKAFHIKLNIDSEDQQIEEDMVDIQIPSIENCTKERLTQLIQKMFGFQQFREGQFQTIDNMLKGKSTIFVSETASGKSLTYILSSLIMANQNGGMSIVISPLIALMLDQLEHLPYQIPAACISSLLDYQQRGRILNMVKQDKVKLLFMTPETLMSDILFHLKQFPRINLICVDEAHCLSQLSHNFRTSYLALSQIILRQFKYNNEQQKCNILCLTATANTQTVESLSKKLRISQIIKSSSTLNKNLYITISREIGLDNKMCSLVQYLNRKQIQQSQGALIYCRAKYIIEKVFYFLCNSNINATIFHGGLSNKQKTEIITKFKSQQIKIIISTTALGMGLDFQHLDCIVHFNMPKSLESFVQEIGRAGRRQTRAYCHLFLDQTDFFMERNYILADQLQDQSLKTIISQIQKSRKIYNNTNKAILQKKDRKKLQKKNNEEDSIDRIIKMASIEIQKLQQNKFQQYQLFQQKEQNSGNIQIENQENQQNDKNQQDNQNQQNIQNNQNELNNQNKNELNSQNEQNKWGKLYYMRVKQLSQKTYLRQQSLLTILIKLSQILNKQIQKGQKQMIRILPLSSQILKISFFKSNQKHLLQSQHGQFFKKLTHMQQIKGKKPTCKKLSGSYHIHLITKCNEIQLTPIELLSKVYQISNSFTLKVQLINQVYVFAIADNKASNLNNISSKQISQKLRNKAFQRNVINEVNVIQLTSMTKLNVFFSLAFSYAQITVQQIIKKRMIIGRNQQIPLKNIMCEITNYFHSDLDKFFLEITDAKDQQQIQIFLPTQIITKQEYDTVYDNVKLFFKHQFSNIRDIKDQKQIIQRKTQSIDQFRDGKIITRVFLGVNQEKTSRKIFGDHSYWKRFIKKKYIPLLHIIRWLIETNQKNLLQI